MQLLCLILISLFFLVCLLGVEADQTVTASVFCCCCPRSGETTVTIQETATVTVTNTNISDTTNTTKYATTTITGPSNFIPPQSNYSFLTSKPPVQLHKGVIGYFKDWAQNNTLVGICGKNTSSSTSRYWVAITTKYLRADSVYYPNPNNHPLCQGTICVKIFGPSTTMVFQIFDSFSSPKSEEDVAVAQTEFTQLGYTGDVDVVYWEFVQCPTQLGPI